MISLRHTVLTVATLNLCYFGVEFVVALRAGSVALLADSVDFLEDAAVNILVFFALAWTAARRAKVGMVLAGLLMIPALAFLWSLWEKVQHPLPPAPAALTFVGLGALVVNVTAAFLLGRHRKESGSLTRAAYLSSRNDALANLGIIGAGLLTLAYPSVWPDVVVGLVIAGLNLGAAHEVWEAAHKEANDKPG